MGSYSECLSISAHRIFINFIGVLFLLQLVRGTLASSKVDEPTDFVCTEKFGHFPDPGNCSRYVICDHGRAVLHECNKGLYYSIIIKTCDWPRNVDCANGERYESDLRNPKIERFREPSNDITEDIPSPQSLSLPKLSPLSLPKSRIKVQEPSVRTSIGIGTDRVVPRNKYYSNLEEDQPDNVTAKPVIYDDYDYPEDEGLDRTVSPPYRKPQVSRNRATVSFDDETPVKPNKRQTPPPVQVLPVTPKAVGRRIGWLPVDDDAHEMDQYHWSMNDAEKFSLEKPRVPSEAFIKMNDFRNVNSDDDDEEDEYSHDYHDRDESPPDDAPEDDESPPLPLKKWKKQELPPPKPVPKRQVSKPVQQPPLQPLPPPQRPPSNQNQRPSLPPMPQRPPSVPVPQLPNFRRLPQYIPSGAVPFTRNDLPKKEIDDDIKIENESNNAPLPLSLSPFTGSGPIHIARKIYFIPKESNDNAASNERSNDRSNDRSNERSNDRSGERSYDRSGERSYDEPIGPILISKKIIHVKPKQTSGTSVINRMNIAPPAPPPPPPLPPSLNPLSGSGPIHLAKKIYFIPKESSDSKKKENKIKNDLQSTETPKNTGETGEPKKERNVRKPIYDILRTKAAPAKASESVPRSADGDLRSSAESLDRNKRTKVVKVKKNTSELKYNKKLDNIGPSLVRSSSSEDSSVSTQSVIQLVKDYQPDFNDFFRREKTTDSNEHSDGIMDDYIRKDKPDYMTLDKDFGNNKNNNQRDNTRENSRYNPQDDSREDLPDKSRNNLRNNPRDIPKNNLRDNPRNNPKDVPKDNSRDNPRNNPRDVPKDNSRDNPFDFRSHAMHRFVNTDVIVKQAKKNQKSKGQESAAVSTEVIPLAQLTTAAPPVVTTKRAPIIRVKKIKAKMAKSEYLSPLQPTPDDGGVTISDTGADKPLRVKIRVKPGFGKRDINDNDPSFLATHESIIRDDGSVNSYEDLVPLPAIPLEKASKCTELMCQLPNCRCGSTETPVGLEPKKIPQIVMVTFDDSINDLNWDIYDELFNSGRTNPNGCPILSTFYVSHEWTDYSQVQTLYSRGHEMASHSITHSFGDKFSKNQWLKEIAGQREILNLYGGVRKEDVRGMRAPFLQTGGDTMFEMLRDANFTYDSSLPVYEISPPFWPYTFDYAINHECMIPPCPSKSFPGLWEVGMVMWEDLRGGRCSMADACFNPKDESGVYEMINNNFMRHYSSNRAPFGMYFHSRWFLTEHNRRGFMRFLDEIMSHGDVFLTTNWQMIQWMKNPTPMDAINSFAPWQCKKSKRRPPPCEQPHECKVKLKNELRVLKTCQQCPKVYPWVDNNGLFKNKN